MRDAIVGKNAPGSGGNVPAGETTTTTHPGS